MMETAINIGECLMYEWPSLNRFYFIKREWLMVGHEDLVLLAMQSGFQGLHAAEGGFDLPTSEDRYSDARYDSVKERVMSLWNNGISDERMWMLRLIFRLSGIATFESQMNAFEYFMERLKYG